MRRLFLPLLIALLSLSVPMTAAQDGTPAPALPLTLVDSLPAGGAELSDAEAIVLYFSAPVDCASAEAALVFEPALDGAITCDEAEASVTFTPSEAFVRGANYTLTIGTDLRGQDGELLAEPATIEWSTLGYLEVAEVLPAPDTGQVAADAVITVIFNRPVVPLVGLEDRDSLPDPLQFDPAAQGDGEWLNTSIYVFRPDPAMAGGTEYTITVDADLTSADGATMAAPYSWSFTTAAPRVASVLPTDMSSAVELDEPIQVTFNQAVEQGSAEEAFYLRPSESEGGTVPGSFEWSEDGTGFMFRPDENLALDTVYEVGFAAERVRSQGGGASLEGTAAWQFSTVPAPAIIGTDPFDGSEDAPAYASFTIYFASPMNPDTLEDKVEIDPEPWREFDSYYGSWDNSYTVSFPSEPSTRYTITVKPGMEDVYGNAIERATVVTYTTRPFDPDVNLQVPGGVGFYNADNEQTQLFLTHRNVSRIDLELYSVPARNFMAAAAGDNYWDPASSFSPDMGNLIRRWQIPSVAPLNARRYELLDLGSSEAVQCAGAPETRLQVGDIAVVISDPDPVRARETAPDGEVKTLLYRDYRLPVVGGPMCADEMLWWEVELRDGTTAWVAEGTEDEYFLDVQVASARTPVAVTDADGGPLAPGIYFLRANSPETVMSGSGPLWVTHFLVVGNANLTMKSSVDSLLIWATDVNTGQPIANAPITIYDRSVRVIAEGTTDADGLLVVDVPRVTDLYVPRIALLDNGDYFGLNIDQWSQGIEGYQFNQNTNYYPERYRTYLYTDRPVYRPDQPVYFRGVVRLADDVTYTLPDFGTIPVQIINDAGEVVYDQELELTPFGTFSGQFNLSADAPLGYYRIAAQLPGVENMFYSSSGSVSFTVAEYRVPEFQVTLTPEQPAVAQGDTIRVVVESRYFFGGAVSNASVEYSVIAAPYYFNYTGSGNYSFYDFDADGGPSEFYSYGQEQIMTGTGVTDAQGQLLLEIPADLEDATQSRTFTIEAVVSDESNQVVAGRTDVVVHKGLLYVGVQPENYVEVAGDPALVNLIAVNWDSDPIADQELEVIVVERRWSSVQEEDEFGRTIWTYEVEEIPVTQGSVATDADGKATFTFTPTNGGIFKITTVTRDSVGSEVRAANTVWVSSREYVAWRQQNSNRIDLIADNDSYIVGDTAEILITSPFQGSAEALITVERGDVLKAERVTMDSNSYVYTLPIEPEFAPNVYVSVVLVKGVDENNPVAAFRMGLVQLGVDNAQKEITIEIEPDVEQAGPGETVTYTVRTTDHGGAPVSAEVGVGLTDLATLSIGQPNSTPILPFYYGQQGLGVRTSTPLTINTDQITQTVLDTIKGGGGGFGEGGIFDIRQEFVDTAYWNAELLTGADGEANFTVTLPDNLTTWRLDARAVTSGEDGITLVGQNTFDLLSTKPLLIRPVTPRFFVVDDEVVVAAIVNNNTEQDLEVEVTLEATGVAFSGEAAQTVAAPAGGRVRVEWPLRVLDVDAVDFTFFAADVEAGYSDASKPPLGQGSARTLPVYRFEVPEVTGTAGVLREAGTRTETIVLPRDANAESSSLAVTFSPSLASTTIDGLDYLRNYPHQCVEQTVSRFLPNIMTYRALDKLGLADAELEQALRDAVNFALQRLYAEQKVNGGWGWFVQDNSNPLTTAYALIGMAEAERQGFTVDAASMRSARNYLRTTFIVPGLDQPTWRLNRQAFVLYALARAGDPDVARTTTLYESRARLDLYAKAFLAQTLHLIDPADTARINTLLSDLNNAAIASATGIHWEEEARDYYNWNTNTRTTAIVLETLVILNPDSELIPNVVRWLMTARTADAWETTQETAWAVMALTDWMVASGELEAGYSYTASLNDELLSAEFVAQADVMDDVTVRLDALQLIEDEANALVITRDEGPGSFYYTAFLTTSLPVPQVEPVQRGIIIERRYTLPDETSSITEARIGDLVQVHLTIIAPNDLHYVVIEDPIPAGTDAVNPDLETSQQIGTQPEVNLQDPLSRGWGWWWFSNVDFRDEKVVLYSTYLPAGTYEYVYTIRAGLEGVFNVIPATGQEFYFPDVYGRSAGSTFAILPAAE